MINVQTFRFCPFCEVWQEQGVDGTRKKGRGTIGDKNQRRYQRNTRQSFVLEEKKNEENVFSMVQYLLQIMEGKKLIDIQDLEKDIVKYPSKE